MQKGPPTRIVAAFACLIFGAFSCSCSPKNAAKESNYISIGLMSSVVDHPMPTVIISSYFDDVSKMPYDARNGDLLILIEPNTFTAVAAYLKQTAEAETWAKITDNPEHKKRLITGIHTLILNTNNEHRLTYHLTKDQEIDTLLGIARLIVNIEKRSENWLLILARVDEMLSPDTKHFEWSHPLTERYNKIGLADESRRLSD